MRNIKNKQIQYQNLLIKCVEGIHEKPLKEKIYNNISGFKQRSILYNNLAGKQVLYSIPSDLQHDITHDNMIFLYGKLRDSTHSRAYYDKVLSSSSICPYCGVQISSSLDHYLPKKHYPMYAVDPVNLVPSCSDCNTNKGEHKQLQGTETLHPYFDKLSEMRFLNMRVEEVEGKVAFKYSITMPTDLNVHQYNKVSNHFDLLELANMYSILASSEVHSQIYNFKKLFIEGGKQVLQQNLEDIYLSNCDAEINSWKTALYDGLRKSEWFCEQGIFIFEYVSIETEDPEELIQIPKK